MTGQSLDCGGDARKALHAIVSDPQHGPEALSRPRVLTSLLKDLLPDAPRETGLLIAAADANLAGMLRESMEQGLDAATASRLASGHLAQSSAFTSDACDWVSGELAVALGYQPPGAVQPSTPQATLSAAGYDNRPAQPGQLNHSGQPTQPTQPTQPGQPTYPGQPGQPTYPGQPGQPTYPGQLTQPGQPGQPTQPGQPSQPGRYPQYPQNGAQYAADGPYRQDLPVGSYPPGAQTGATGYPQAYQYGPPDPYRGQSAGPPVPPPSIRRAVRLQYAGAGLALVQAIVGIASLAGPRASLGSPGSSYVRGQVFSYVLVAFVSIALWLWMAWASKRGQIWARILSAVLFALATFVLIASLVTTANAAGRLVFFAEWVIGLLTIISQWQRTSSEYYGARSRQGTR